MTQAKEDVDTRQHLLETAGRLFAEKGFERTTSKEICALAGANTAAVNYHFGGIEELYVCVVREAHHRFLTFEALAAAVAGKSSARAKFQALADVIIRALAGPLSTSWAFRVIGREFVAPSPIVDAQRDKPGLPKMHLIQQVVGDLMGLPADHPLVDHGCVYVLSPFILLLIADARALKRAFPGWSLTLADAQKTVQQTVRYSIAGLSVLAAESRAKKK